MAEDWDVVARFFLCPRCRHIDKFLYRLQYQGGNTTFQRYDAIQDHLDLGRLHYAEAFKEAAKAWGPLTRTQGVIIQKGIGPLHRCVRWLNCRGHHGRA